MPYVKTTYVLDPDLAVPYIVRQKDRFKYGPLYTKYSTVKETISAFDIRTAKQKRFSEKNMFKVILSSFEKSIAEAMELVRWGAPIQRLNVPYYTIRKLVDAITWESLSSLQKQYYIPLESTYDERYRYGSMYAGLKVPQRGSVSDMVYDSNDGILNVRGQKSKILADSSRFLLRMRDGSVLEVYESNFNYLDNLKSLESAIIGINRLLALEPNLAKTYYLAYMLDNVLGRPAYKLSSVVKKGLFEI